MLALATLYVMMTLTNWYRYVIIRICLSDYYKLQLILICCFGVICFFPSPDVDGKELTQNETAMWMKIISCWICIALYLWSLVAPAILVNRDFD